MISVVGVHGLWMHAATMAVLGARLSRSGFAFHDFGYRSVTAPLAANAAALAAFIDGVPGSTVHLVCHSLGGVIACAMLEGRVPSRLHRIVCLGSPLRGSGAAARLARWPGGRRLIGKCLCELQDRGGLAAWRAGVEVGSIAGSLPLGFGRLFGRFAEPNDGTVAVAETVIEGLADHIVLPVSHMALLWSSAVAAQTEHFLRHGRFARAA